MSFRFIPRRSHRRARRSVLSGLKQFAGATAGIVISFASNTPAQAAPWTSLSIDSFSSQAFRPTAIAHLPDGRFLYGVAGQLHVQTDFGAPAKTSVSTTPLLPQVIDPSFIAVRDANTAVVGQGGFGATSSLFSFDPGAVSPQVNPTPLASPQNYLGVYWKSSSPTNPPEGWLVIGGNGTFGSSNVTFVSLDGTKVGAITGTISTFSGGIATDSAGNVYAATYDIDFDTFEPTPDANRVLKFGTAAVESAVQAVIAGTPAPIDISASSFIYQFDSTSNIAVDAIGRIWATGWAVNYLQVFDPATQTTSRIVPEHGSFPEGTDVLYTVRDFTRSGAGYVAFLAQDEYGNAGTQVYTGWTPVSSITVPQVDQWRASSFGVHNLTAAAEATLWGPNADPDHDGLPNLVEYATGTPPTTTSVSAAAADTQAGALRFSFVRDPANTDLIYIVEVSGSLSPAGWQEIARSTAGATTVSSGIGSPNITETAEGGRIRVRVTDPVTGVPRFARLRVVLIAP